MKKTKKVVARVFAFCMAMVVYVAFSITGIDAKAASETQDLFVEKNGTFSSVGSTYTFTTSATKNFFLEIDVVDSSVSVDVVIKSLNNGGSVDGTISSDMWKYDSSDGIYWYTIGYANLPAGSYEVTISSSSYGNYYAVGWAEGALFLNSTSVSLYAGESKTLSVSGTTSAVTWSSSNTSVATVNNSGQVTAKKAGTATITATVDGQSLTCKVTVKKPVISTKSFVITAGQKKTLKVSKNAGKVSWKSSKKAVATVSSKGVVTAKKAGKAKITATVDGCKLTCTVTVKKNEYSASSAKNSQVGYGVWFNTTKISYDKKGQLVCKVQIINNSYYNVQALSNFNITVTDKNGSVIGSQTTKKKTMYISSGSNKSITITIPKSKVKKTNADLRNATPKCSGKYIYRF